MHSLQQLRAAARSFPTAVFTRLRQRRAVTRVSLATLALAVALGLSMQGAAAGPAPEPIEPTSILPEVAATGVPSTSAVSVAFSEAMDTESVVASLSLQPATAWRTSWNASGTVLRLYPQRRWQTDARYVISIRGGSRQADGTSVPAPRRLSFTTETAPVISDFQLYYVDESTADRVRARADEERDAAHAAEPIVPPSDTAAEVSAGTRITIGFSSPMRLSDVERRFTISPAVPGELSWEGGSLVFEPRKRLKPGTRYAVSIIGAHDRRGNRLAGDTAFSFTTRPGAQVVKVTPANRAKDVETRQVAVWFSQPMHAKVTRSAFRVLDLTAGRRVAGTASWNAARTQLRFAFERALTDGHVYRIKLGKGARDLDRNAVAGSWKFLTPEPPAPAPVVAAEPQSRAPAPPPPPGPPAPASLQEYAVWQINQARARYGFAPVRLDAAVSAVASAHAWDMLNHGYFSHTGRDGSRAADRLRRAGVGFSASGENICYHAGIGARATLDWCHGAFMSEPYPGYFNHIANILSPRFSRVGIGIAESGGQVKIVWDFAG